MKLDQSLVKIRIRVYWIHGTGFQCEKDRKREKAHVFTVCCSAMWVPSAWVLSFQASHNKYRLESAKKKGSGSCIVYPCVLYFVWLHSKNSMSSVKVWKRAEGESSVTTECSLLMEEPRMCTINLIQPSAKCHIVFMVFRLLTACFLQDLGQDRLLWPVHSLADWLTLQKYKTLALRSLLCCLRQPGNLTPSTATCLTDGGTVLQPDHLLYCKLTFWVRAWLVDWSTEVAIVKQFIIGSAINEPCQKSLVVLKQQYLEK